jgi:hypothetical protein
VIIQDGIIGQGFFPLEGVIDASIGKKNLSMNAVEYKGESIS